MKNQVKNYLITHRLQICVALFISGVFSVASSWVKSQPTSVDANSLRVLIGLLIAYCGILIGAGSKNGEKVIKGTIAAVFYFVFFVLCSYLYLDGYAKLDTRFGSIEFIASIVILFYITICLLAWLFRNILIIIKMALQRFFGSQNVLANALEKPLSILISVLSATLTVFSIISMVKQIM